MQMKKQLKRDTTVSVQQLEVIKGDITFSLKQRAQYRARTGIDPFLGAEVLDPQMVTVKEPQSKALKPLLLKVAHFDCN